MNSIKFSLLFPAFGADFFRVENRIITDYKNISGKKIKQASEILGIDFGLDDFFLYDTPDDELVSQYKAYIFSSIMTDILKNTIALAEYTTGYSMGIYAALYFCQSIEFEEGLNLIKNAYELIKNTIQKDEYGMGSIIGLEFNDITKIINNNSIDVEIINQNNKLSFVISGKLDEVKLIVDKAKEEGALNTKVLPISAPYHSNFLKDAAKSFTEYLKGINIKDSKYKIISGHNQKVISQKNEIIDELSANIYTKHNWLATMNKLIDLKVNSFFECGAGKSLSKTAKFIEGDYKIYTIKNLNTLTP